jgi:PASTA domain
MENKSPQREERVVLVILGTLFACICLTLVGIGYVVTTRADEIVAAFESPARGVVRTTPRGTNPTWQVPTDWIVVANEQFETLVASSEWDYGSHPFTFGDVTMHVDKGMYVWDITSKKSIYYYMPGTRGFYPEYDVHVWTKADAYVPGMEYGLLFGFKDAANFYVMQVKNESSVVIRGKKSGTWIPVATWDLPDSYRNGEQNELQVIHQGAHFTFLVDDEFAGELDATDISAGRLGLFAELEESNTKGTVRFDDFRVSVPKYLTTPTRTPKPLQPTLPPTTPSPTPTGMIVPNVVGMSPDKAIAAIEAVGLRAEVIVTPADACAGLVNRQEPNVASYLPRGENVTIHICRALTPTP